MKTIRALLLSLAMLAGSVHAEAPAVAQQAPAAAAAPGFAGGLVQLMFGLITVLALLAGALWAVKRMGGRRLAAGSVVKVIGGVSVGSRERVMVVEVADQWIVIGVAPGRVNTLASMPRQEQQAQDIAPGVSSFAAWLKQTRG